MSKNAYARYPSRTPNSGLFYVLPEMYYRNVFKIYMECPLTLHLRRYTQGPMVVSSSYYIPVVASNIHDEKPSRKRVKVRTHTKKSSRVWRYYRTLFPRALIW